LKVSPEQEIGKALIISGVMKVYDDEDRSQLYMVMEWVEGSAAPILGPQRKLPTEVR